MMAKRGDLNARHYRRSRTAARGSPAWWWAERIDAQHAKGKLTARERLDVLLDEARSKNTTCTRPTAAPISAWKDQVYPGDGVITGWGTINGRPVYVFSQDFTVFGGSTVGRRTRRRSARFMDLAVQNGAPLIG
jgi:propionyl-CoA carboxylase beta chain